MRKRGKLAGTLGLIGMLLLLCALPGLGAEEPCDYDTDLLLWEMDEPGLEDSLLLGATYERYFLTLDGRLLVTAEDERALTEMVDRAAEQYVDEDTISCARVEDGRVRLCYGVVNAASETDLSKAWEILKDVFQFDTVDRERTEAALPFERETVYDATVYADEQSEVTTPGEEGTMEIVKRTSYRNGELQELDVVSFVTKEPVTEITKVGTKERPEYIWPVRGRLTSGFGPRNITGGSRNHKGIDLAVPTGTTVRAAKAGRVICAGWNGGYGYLVKLQHDDGDVTYYAHNSRLLVRVGEQVEQGAAIALSGSTGQSTGPHCHFEIRIAGKPVNPLPYVNHT